ncbi:PREDICTED: integral membrane protein GPR155-like [Priapulus caudatus]|uniref:Integral membrane protein GPR155-like n=1 Tax=Priapulus caudatus TaxID=37621 RepID=A0ABM1E3J9_PRICU|nr:PREDICTED: integral membrane protein GPR155-like [Priapulus caudatus]
MADGLHSEVSFSNLYPAILQCFIVILSGYCAGRTNLISSTEARGLGRFVANFALPALVFKAMVELRFDTVNWRFLGSILLAKTCVFVLVAFFTILLSRRNKLGKAGMYAIFSTQSNDFALGFPIVQALYANVHPDYMQYIYLIAPISLVILNPIGFALLEVNRWWHSDSRASWYRVVGNILKGIALNPIVFMTVVGLIGNFVFHQQLPSAIEPILKVLADSFTATALFYLGLSMVGKIQSQVGFALVTPALLIAAKTILLPLITREIVSALDAGRRGGGLGICMLRCRSLCFLLRHKHWLYLLSFGFPVLMTSVVLIVSKSHNEHEEDPNFQYGTNQVVVSAVVLGTCIVVTVTSLVVTQRHVSHHQHSAPYRAINQRAREEDGDEEEEEGERIAKEKRRARQRLSSLSSVRSVNGEGEEVSGERDLMLPRNQQGKSKLASSKLLEDIEDLVHRDRTMSISDGEDGEPPAWDYYVNGTINDRTCLLSQGCTVEQKRKCAVLIKNYDTINVSVDLEGAALQQNADEYQIARHVILLLFLTLSMLIGFFLCIWRLFRDSTSGIYLELEFLDSAFNFCQGFFAFAVFGLDTNLILIPLLKKWRWLRYGSEGICLPKFEDLDDETVHVCAQFLVHHKDKCIADLASDRTHSMKTYKSVFCGNELVDWLLEIGLVHDRPEGVKYGRQLLNGRIICHHSNTYTFYDLPYFYKFLENALS